jgi:hypothetical protein
MGLVCEDIGSRLELTHYKRCYKDPAEKKKRDLEWEEYLRTAFKTEPTGQRYLRTVLLRLKFESNSTAGLLIGAAGLLFITGVSRYLTMGVSAGMVAFAVYLGWCEVAKTVPLLADIRRNLLREIRVVQ